jgi:hypothetical protein
VFFDDPRRRLVSLLPFPFAYGEARTNRFKPIPKRTSQLFGARRSCLARSAGTRGEPGLSSSGSVRCPENTQRQGVRQIRSSGERGQRLRERVRGACGLEFVPRVAYVYCLQGRLKSYADTPTSATSLLVSILCSTSAQAHRGLDAFGGSTAWTNTPNNPGPRSPPRGTVHSLAVPTSHVVKSSTRTERIGAH